MTRAKEKWIKGSWPLIGVILLLVWQWMHRSPEANKKLKSELITIDKAEINLAFHSKLFKPTAPTTNRIWYSPVLRKSEPLNKVAQSKLTMDFLNHPIQVTAGTEILATGQVLTVYWDLQSRIAGYEIVFDSPETIEDLEKKLGIQHPELLPDIE